MLKAKVISDMDCGAMGTENGDVFLTSGCVRPSREMSVMGIETMPPAIKLHVYIAEAAREISN